MPLRIAMLHQREGGGATIAVQELSAGLRALGHEVRDVTPAQGEGVAEVQRRLRALDAQVLHAHCFYNALDYADLLTLAAEWPVCWTLHDVLPVNQFGSECWECARNAHCYGCPALGVLRRWRPNYRTLARSAHRRVNRKLRAHLILPSEWMRRRIARTELAVLPATHIPYGMDLAQLVAAPLAADAAPHVLFAGNMYSAQDHRKGLPDLLAAWPAVQAAQPAARLLIAGRVDAQRLPAGVTSLGELNRAQLQRALHEVRVVCVPSRGDNLPLAVIEAMAAGRCVVATHVGGIADMLRDGVSGLLVPPENPSRLAAALGRALQPDALAPRLGAAAAGAARATWSLDLCAQRHTALYESLL